MTYQSTFTGNQVDAAIGRVADNEFAPVIIGSLDASSLSPMTVTGTESKYLTPLLSLEPNSRYIAEILFSYFPDTQVDFAGGVSLAGQDIATSTSGIAMRAALLGGNMYSRYSTFSVPGLLAYTDLAGASFDTTESMLARFIGEVETGANPQVRAYYWANYGDITIRTFHMKFTKVYSDNIQAPNVAAPQA